MCQARSWRSWRFATVSRRKHVSGVDRGALHLTVCAVLGKAPRPHKDAVVVYLVHDSDADDLSGDEQPS